MGCYLLPFYQSILLKYSFLYSLMPLSYPDQCSLAHKKWKRHETPVSVSPRSGCISSITSGRGYFSHRALRDHKEEILNIFNSVASVCSARDKSFFLFPDLLRCCVWFLSFSFLIKRGCVSLSDCLKLYLTQKSR